MLKDIEAANISTDGLFLNANAGFDTTGFRTFRFKNNTTANIHQNTRNGSDNDYLFYDLRYKCRFVIERTNAWIDAFKAILIRFETTKKYWKALIY